ncbi:MAG: LysR family transcriptional regulator [Rhodomicrobium sp.]
MNWEDLRHFLALAKTGSFSEAGRRLNVDHTTVARRVAELEAALGLRLIDRLPRAVMLTPDGIRIADLGGRMEEESFAIARAAGSAGPEIAGRVRVSAPPAFASVVIAPGLVMLKQRHPGLAVDLIGEQRVANLDHREAEVALRLSRPTGKQLIARKVGEMAFALYAKAGYAEERAEPDWEFVTHDDLADELPQQRWLNIAAQGRPVVFRANDAASLASAARAGMGVALLPLFLGEGDPALAKLPSPKPPPRRDIWMVVHDDLRRAPRIRVVMDFLAGLIAACGKEPSRGMPV